MSDDRSKPGSKPMKPTKTQRNDVMLYMACGLSEEGIAAVIGITRPTLRQHFAWELANGRAVKKAENYKRLQKAAEEGNVTAMKFLALQLDRGFAEDLPPKPPELGKKAQARVDARNPDTSTTLGALMARRQQEPVN